MNIRGKAARENFIIQSLSQSGSVKIIDLSKELKVSRETIRRDLHDMEENGLLRCTHGGAVIDIHASHRYEAAAAHVKYVNEKTAIGKKAAEFIDNNDTVIILYSTTIERIGPYLKDKNHLTVITNSFVIAEYTLKNQTNSVIMLGGDYNSSLQATTGNVTATTLARYRADKLFFCPSGVSKQFGVTDYPESDADVVKSALSVSKQSILLSDYTKFWNTGLYRVCDISDIDIVISDSKLSQVTIDEYDGESPQIVIAEDVNMD